MYIDNTNTEQIPSLHNAPLAEHCSHVLKAPASFIIAYTTLLARINIPTVMTKNATPTARDFCNQWRRFDSRLSFIRHIPEVERRGNWGQTRMQWGSKVSTNTWKHACYCTFMQKNMHVSM